ncbi:TnsA endonuclease N-terminal domain-containing protein [Roseateles sp. So40a]|uniref:TnsA endonuclease N-terminal domain-containing protein n=1 Tax=Roseateles sp. So40a TaxID=3400226 RepID=UPI003A879F33
MIPSPLHAGRAHHVLSDLERNVFLALLTFRPVDVREQYPLMLESGIDVLLLPPGLPELSFGPGTLAIAKEQRIRHPPHKGSTAHMTTDFVVTLGDGSIVAVHCKWAADLAKIRNIQLRKLEEEYWRQRDVRLVVVTEVSMPRRLVNNLKWALSAMSSDANYRANNDIPSNWIRDVFDLNASKRFPMRGILERLALTYEVTVEQQVVWLKKAVMFGLIPVDHSTTDLHLASPWKMLNGPAAAIHLLGGA